MFLLLIQNDDERLKVERLYDKYKVNMFYIAYNILHDKHLAEDAVHQSFIHVINNLEKINENNCHKTRGFLVVICKNISYDIYKNKTYLNKEDIMDEMIDTSNEPSAIIINEETVRRIIDQIKSLKPIYQDVILLKYSHELSNEEISKLLGISSDVVRKRIERGKEQLGNLLKKEELK